MGKSSFIKKNIAIFVIVIILIVVASIIIRYYVEGEQNMPFEVSKIMVISSAEGIQKEGSQIKWDLNLNQNNDIYIDIIKNKNFKSGEIIENIKLDNFKVEGEHKLGEIKIYRPNSDEKKITTNEEYLVKNEIQFEGSQRGDLANLKVANQGGLLILRFTNSNIGTYTSNDELELRHDGTLLGKAGLTNEQIQFTISFDITIELKSEKKYKATVTLDLPQGNLIQEGTTNYQINKNKIVFKR